jgi:hypothetical protein
MVSNVDAITAVRRIDVASESIRNTLKASDGLAIDVISAGNLPVAEDRAAAYATVNPSDNPVTRKTSQTNFVWLKVRSSCLGFDMTACGHILLISILTLSDFPLREAQYSPYFKQENL